MEGNRKRRALGDADDEGRYKSQPFGSVPAASPGANGAANGHQLARGRRHAAYLRKVRALNTQFAAWVKTQVPAPRSSIPGHAPVPLTAGVADYAKHAKQLQQDYQDVLEGEEATGSLLVWGTGDMGQLGLGEEVSEKLRPCPLSLGGRAVRAVECGGMHTLAVTADGALWSWGVNDEGALGREVKSSNEHTSHTAAPAAASALPDNEPGEVTVGIPQGDPFVQVSAGDSHSCAVTASGAVYAWGAFRDSSGLWAFKPGVKIQQFPALVVDPKGPSGPIKQVASGADHVVALNARGEVWTWGCGERGRLGRLQEAQTKRDNQASLLAPARVTGALEGETVVGVGAGFFSSYAITSSGAVYGWGMNNYGQLAWPVPTEKGKAGDGFFSPRVIDALAGRNVTAIAGGEHHALALTKDGTVLSFGRATYGRLGRPGPDTQSDEPYDAPERVELPGAAVRISAGVSVSAAVLASGAVHLWGYGDTGQLGKGSDEADELAPVKLKATKHFSGATALSISFGGQHAAMVAKE